MSKQLTAAFQGVVTDEPGTDCGVRRTLRVTITKENQHEFRLRWIIEGGKKVLLTKAERMKRLGQEVELRSKMFCRTRKICSVCAGELPYRLRIRNVGLTYNGVGETLKKLAMKSFHDSRVKLARIDLDAAVERIGVVKREVVAADVRAAPGEEEKD